MQKGHVDRQSATAEEIGHIRQKDGHVRGSAGIDSFPGIRSHEESSVVKAAGKSLLDIRGTPVGMEMDDLYLLQRMVRTGFPSSGEGVNERLRERIGSMDKDSLTGSNGEHCLVGANEHNLVYLSLGCASRRLGIRPSGHIG